MQKHPEEVEAAEMNLAAVQIVLPIAKDENEPVVPYARSGHRVVACPGAVYSIGGYNPEFWDEPNDEGTIYPLFSELWKLNTTTSEWRLLKTTGYTPREMASHTALLVGNKLFVHGGTGTPFGGASSNELHVCDLSTLTWKHIQTDGDQPEKLYGHSLTLSGSSLYTFGGTTGYVYRNELHRLDLRTRTWSALPADKSRHLPEGRYRHEAVSDGEYLYILGGGSTRTNYAFETIDAYHLAKCRWEQLTCYGAPSPRRLPGAPIDGAPQRYPPPRRCHAAVLYKRGVYILGGYDQEDVFDDVWRLDLDSRQWQLHTRLLQPVYFHSADVTQYGTVYVFGGVNKIDDERNSDVYTFCLDPPPLREQSWRVVYRHLAANMAAMDRSDLLELGIPAAFIGRL